MANYSSLGTRDAKDIIFDSIDISAMPFTVDKLSAISANIGNVTAGSIAGVTMDLGSGKFVVDANGKLTMTIANRWGNDAAINLANSDITGLNGLYLKDVADNEGEGLLFLRNGYTAGDYSNSTTNYYTLRVDGYGTLMLDGRPVFYTGQGTFLLDTAAYPNDGATLTPSRTLAQCPNGWIIVWSDFDTPNIGQNYNWYTSVVPKYVGDNGNEWSFAIPVGNSTGTYDTMASKSLTIYNDKIVGNAGNNVGLAADVVLRYVIAF
jgi:hypothetical protein